MKVTNPIPILITYFQKEKVKKKTWVFFIFFIIIIVAGKMMEFSEDSVLLHGLPETKYPPVGYGDISRQ